MLPDGRDVDTVIHRWGMTDAGLARRLADQAARTTRLLDTVTGYTQPEATRLLPGWAGEPFNLGDCIYALFDLATIEHRNQQQPDAA